MTGLNTAAATGALGGAGAEALISLRGERRRTHGVATTIARLTSRLWAAARPAGIPEWQRSFTAGWPDGSSH